jgi:hypothetical protein
MEQSANGEADRYSADQEFDHVNNMKWTAQIINLSQINTYRWSFLSVCYHKLHARTTSTQLAARTHCATPSTQSLAILTQSADSGCKRPAVCRSLIIKLHTWFPLWHKKRITATVRKLIYFIITINRYMFRLTSVIISTAVQNVLT